MPCVKIQNVRSLIALACHLEDSLTSERLPRVRVTVVLMTQEQGGN